MTTRQTTLVPVAELGEAGHVIPTGTEWARVACPTHGDVWCAIDRADARRRRAPCPRCERHEPADPPRRTVTWTLGADRTWKETP